MKAALLATLVGWVGVSGCAVNVDPDRALPYRCDPGSTLGDAQCAGGWRCAQDGFCRDPSLGAATPCAESDDCLGGWHCGVSKLCYDRTLATAIPCRPSLEAEGSSDCAPGWRCPSGGICQQVGIFGPYPCQTCADCEAGSHCGLSARCYLRELAEGVPCRQELDHDPVERDCAPDWICSANGRCVDARAYDLRENGPLSSVRAEPVGSGPAVDHLSSECYRESVDPVWEKCLAVTALTIARGSSVELHRIPSTGAVAPPVVLTLAGPISALATTTRTDGTLHAYSLVVVNGETLHVSWPPSGAPVVTKLAVPFVPGRLLAQAALPWLFGVSGPDLFLVAQDGTAVLGPVRLPDAQAGGPLDYGAISAFGLAGDFWLVALSADGAFATRTRAGAFGLPDGGVQPLPAWTPVRFAETSHRACAGDDGGTGTVIEISPTRTHSSTSGTFQTVRVAVVPSEGAFAGRPLSYLLQARVDVTPTSCSPAGTATAPCPSCPVGGTLVRLDGFGDRALCSVPVDGGTRVAEAPIYWGACGEPVLAESLLGSRTLSAVSPGGQRAWAYGASDGQTILRVFDAVRAVPLRLNRAPVHLGLGAGGEALAYAGGFTYAAGATGFELRDIETSQSCASIRGAEAYRLSSNASAVIVTGPTPDFGLADSADSAASEEIPSQCTATTPILAETISQPDGGMGVIVATRDRVWANTFPPVPGAPWPVRTSPAPFATITSLATLAPSMGTTAWGSAYVLANEQVYSLRADTLIRWSAGPLAGPHGDPFRVWADPKLGRVTYRDGSTFSLPFFSRLAGPIPGEDPQLADLGEICGAAFVAGGAGLFRLEAAAGWQLVPTPQVASAPWTKLHTLGERLFAFTREGHALEVIDETCLRP